MFEIDLEAGVHLSFSYFFFHVVRKTIEHSLVNFKWLTKELLQPYLLLTALLALPGYFMITQQCLK